jgi:hypothetical protein
LDIESLQIEAGEAGDERATAAPLDDRGCALLAVGRTTGGFGSSFEQKFFVIPETNDGGVRAARSPRRVLIVVPAKALAHTA